VETLYPEDEFKCKWLNPKAEFGDFVELVQQMQKNFAHGKSAFARATLTTVTNGSFGITGGVQVDVVLIYNSRMLNWEAKLPEQFRARFVHPNKFMAQWSAEENKLENDQVKEEERALQGRLRRQGVVFHVHMKWNHIVFRHVFKRVRLG
jgi:hypothetical protein